MERKIDDLVWTLRDAVGHGKKCTLLIGAGCSVQAGIPTAARFVDMIEERNPPAYGRATQKTYPHCMAELPPSARRDLIAEFVDQAQINWAHLAIAQLMKLGFVDRVLTVNFDPLVSKDCALVGGVSGGLRLRRFAAVQACRHPRQGHFPSARATLGLSPAPHAIGGG